MWQVKDPVFATTAVRFQSLTWEISHATVLDKKKKKSYIFQMTFLILVMASLIVDQGVMGSGGPSFLFHTLKDQ